MARMTRWGLPLYGLLCLIWGSTWMVIKVGYGGLGPFNVAGLRFVIAGALMAVVALATRARWPTGRAEWQAMVLVGLLMFAGDYGLIYWAEQYIESGLTAVLFATLPLMTLFVARAYLPGDRITAGKLASSVLALAGTVALFADRLRLDAGSLPPMIAVLGAVLCAAVASVVSKRDAHDIPPATLNATSMLIGAAALLLAALAHGEGFRLPTDAATWAAVSYLALAGSVLAFLIYFSLLKTWSVMSLSFISVFTPAIALLLGFVFLHEPLTAGKVGGTVLILVAVALANRR
ncbi:MAG TPA: EamA family transporter [Vicinamibacterales bacterium]|nr:EamA family transporter [Vicinamibacterales bacterium]